MEDVGNRWVGSREEGGAEDGRNREIPGLREARDATGDPYVSGAATGRVRNEQVRGQARAGVTGVRRLGGSKRPSSGWTEVNSDTAEQTTLRTAL